MQFGNSETCCQKSCISLVLQSLCRLTGSIRNIFLQHLERLAVEPSYRLSPCDVCQGPPFSTTPVVRLDLYPFLHTNSSGLLDGWGLREPTPAEREERRVPLMSTPSGFGVLGRKGPLHLPTFPCATACLLVAGNAGDTVCYVGTQTALALGAAGAHLSWLLPRLGSQEWAEFCEHRQAEVWLPSLSAASDQPLSLPPGSL